MLSLTAPPEAGALLDRYLISLDDDELDDAWASGLFTEDAWVAFPMSRHDGLPGLADYHRRSLAAFARTQHLGSRPVAEPVDADTVRLRASVVSTHVYEDAGAPGAAPLFVAGTLVHGRARRTGDGWRLAALDFRVLWTTGTPPGARGAGAS